MALFELLLLPRRFGYTPALYLKSYFMPLVLHLKSGFFHSSHSKPLDIKKIKLLFRFHNFLRLLQLKIGSNKNQRKHSTTKNPMSCRIVFLKSCHNFSCVIVQVIKGSFTQAQISAEKSSEVNHFIV